MRTDAMLTSSIVLLRFVNNVAASAAPFLALLASALEKGQPLATTDVAKGPARIPDSRRTKKMESPTPHDRSGAQGTFSLVERSATSGRVRNHNDEPDGELLRRMT
jgi:hypothetical protein